MTAIEVYRRHARQLDDNRLGAMINQAVVYSLRRIWHHEVAVGVLTVQISEHYPDVHAFEDLFRMHIMDEARRLLSGIELQLFDALLTPEPDDITLRCCYELFKLNGSKPIQTGELTYLAVYFNRSRREIETLFYGMRARLLPLLMPA